MHDERRAAVAADGQLCAQRLASEETPVVVFDLSFDDIMSESNVKSTVSQLKYSYSILRKNAFILKPLFCSCGTASGLQLQNFEGFRMYPPLMHEEHWEKVIPKNRVVYLSADSTEVLQSVEPNMYYVVGAFVDHNSKRGLTESTATMLNVRTARLPLDETIVIGNMCKVLTINAVTEVLATFATTKSWKQAFATLPTRRNKAQREPL